MTIHFFGDSNVFGKNSTPASWYLQSSHPDSVETHATQNHAENGAKLPAIQAQIQAATFAAGDQAVIGGGVNDLALGKTPAEVDARMSRAIASLPVGIDFVILPVFPCITYASDILATNALLAAHHEFLNVTYDDLRNPDHSLSTFYGQPDGLHLTPAGQRSVAIEAMAALGHLHHYADWTHSRPGRLHIGNPGDWLEKRWEVWPKPIAITSDGAHQSGYTGALACVPTQSDFTLQAEISLPRDNPQSFFSFVTEATHEEWIQSGFNFMNGESFRIAHWKSGVHTNDLATPETDYAFDVAAIYHGLVRFPLTLTHYQGVVHLFVNGEKLHMSATVPLGLPGDRAGFWMRDCYLHKLSIEDAVLKPTNA